jgi:hypothetical protein
MFFFLLFHVLGVVFLDNFDVLFHASFVSLVEFHALMIINIVIDLIRREEVLFQILLFYQKAVRPSLALPRTSTLDLGVF